MKSTVSNEIQIPEKRVLPYIVEYDGGLVFIGKLHAGTVIHGKNLGEEFGEGDRDWESFPLYKGTVTLSN